MIDDDATPEELDAWYRRTPDQIAAEKADKWNAAWSALRLPDHLAYEPDDAPQASGSDQTAATGDAVDAAARAAPPVKNAWANPELGLLDVLASGEVPDINDMPRYDVLATKSGQPSRRLPQGADGKPDYSRFPNDPIWTVDKAGRRIPNTSAGRYQFKQGPWNDIVKAHPDVTDFSPLNQDKAAWYLAARDYRTRTHGRDLSADLVDENAWPQIASKLKETWSSLPGGKGQQMTQDEFNQRLRAATARYGAVGLDP